MLEDPGEIAIISKAGQVKLRDPRRPRTPFVNILEDFFSREQLASSTILDLGPGQFDFGEIARHYGAVVDSVDNDPAVVALGRYKGFHVFPADLAELASFVGGHFGRYDGLFCKFSFNAFWFPNREAVRRHSDHLCALIKPDGWAWLAPWNGGHQDLPERLREELLEEQIESFVAHGFDHFELTEWQTRRYGVHGVTANRPVFTRNLSFAKPGVLKVLTGLYKQRLAG